MGICRAEEHEPERKFCTRARPRPIARSAETAWKAKPTMGFEPMTPALRERCSGQLSYVGVGGECSRGLAFFGHGSQAEDSSRARVLGAADRTRLGAVTAGGRVAAAGLPVGAYLRNALPTRPLLAGRRRR